MQEGFIRLARSAHRIEDQSKAAAYLRSIVLNLARDHNRRGLVSLRHHLPFDDRAGVHRGRDRPPRRPAGGHRRAARAAPPPARLPRAPLLRGAGHRRHRRHARDLPQLGQDAPPAGPGGDGDRLGEVAVGGPDGRGGVVSVARSSGCATRSSEGARRRSTRATTCSPGCSSASRTTGGGASSGGGGWASSPACVGAVAGGRAGNRGSQTRRADHGLVDPGAAVVRPDGGAGPVARAVHPPIREELRGRRLPGQPPHGQELHRADGRRVLPDLLRRSSSSRCSSSRPTAGSRR